MKSMILLSDPYPKTIEWSGNGFDKYHLSTHASPGDGSCILHAVSNASYKIYQIGIQDDKARTRTSIIAERKRQLYNWLEMSNSISQLSRNYDSLINNSRSLSEMKNVLYSNKRLDSSYLELLQKSLSINIFILDSDTSDVLRETMYGDYPSAIVIYYNMRFDIYSMVSLYSSKDGAYRVLFDVNHPFIQFLVDRINSPS